MTVSLLVSKKWAMPNKHTFTIKPIRELIERHKAGLIVDPFANQCRIAEITNDLDPQYDTTYNMDALVFLRTLDSNSVDTMLFDPPYSPRQVSESYKKLAMAVNMQTTQSSFWTKLKHEIARVMKGGGKVITCAWNSGGIGKSNGFKQIEILIVAHGGWHNDTIITIETYEGE